jgi:tetratricopeptide (TPR) repeat protein
VSLDLTALRDEASLLRRSLDDARDEHLRGDLDDASLAAIERRDGDRLAEVQAQIAVATAPSDPTGDADQIEEVAVQPPRRRPRRLLAVVALCGALLVAGVVIVLSRPSPSPPVHLSKVAKVQVLLVAAELEVARGTDHLDAALTAYHAVLRLDARNPEALAESGWLRYEIGLRDRKAAEVAAGEAALRRAVRLAPREAAGHLYLGIVLLQHEKDRRAALAQLWRAAALPESSYEQSLTANFIAIARHGP